MIEVKISNFNNIWLISDIHFGVRSNSLEWIQNIVNYFNNFFIPLIKNNKKDNDICCILGDIFDNRQNIDIDVFNKASDVIEDISKILPVHMICGNHDLYKKNDTDVNSLRGFKNIQNVNVYEVPTILNNGDNCILMLPWLGESFDESKLNNYKIDYIFAHSDIQGFKYDNGKDITKGLSLKDINLKRVYSGHIHKRQENNNWVYLGSPYHTKRSDIDNVKGIYCLHTSDNTHTFYKNDYSPIFQKIHINNLLELTLSQVIGALNNNYTDIIISQDYINT
ncbi:MAG: metallophosphoesterase, partial [Clostridia bacterium]